MLISMLNVPSQGGYSALMTACLKGHANVVEHLAKAGAEVNAQNEVRN